MNFSHLKVKYLLINLLIALAYPALKGLRSDHKLLAFSDGCTYIGLFLLIAGIINTFFLKGDFDITGFVASRAFSKDKKDFDSYMKEQEDKRKEGFNYPLLCAFILLLIAYVSALFV